MSGMTREDVAGLLPFAVNGSLAPTEAREVEDWLARDPDLQDDAGFLTRLRGMMRAEPLPQTGTEFALARLMRDLPPQLAPETAQPAAQAHTALASARRWRAPAMAAALAALVVGLGTAALMRPAPQEAPIYEQASGDAAELPRLTVTFAPEARLSEVAALLQAQDLVIVDGPGALGLYRLELPPGADAAAVAEALAQAPIVASVELPE